jgi:N-acetylmuramoyl-L-alanine amidase
MVAGARRRHWWSGRAARIVAALGVLGLGVAAAAAAQDDTAAGVLKVRLGGDAHQTRIVIELDRSAQGRIVAKATSARTLVMALPQVGAPGGMQGQGAGLVKDWSVDDASGGARIRLDLVRPAVVKRRFLLAPGDGVSVYRYVIDLAEDSDDVDVPVATPPTYASADVPPPPAAAPAPRAVKAKAPLQPLTPSRKVVVIDAGHGGKDSGALGSDVREKDLTLAAAHALRDRLERSGRYHVVLTRDTDVFIPLEQRVQIARRANADLFISLHADSGGDPAIRGATVYTLSEKGADRAARKAIDHEDFVNVALPGSDEAVNRILLDLTQRGTVNRSSTFAENVLHRISDVTPLLQRSHRDAGYMVLLAPDVPAVLLEMGFVTNPEDEHALADPDHRRELMDGVAQAIDDYFAEESRLAMR